MRKFATVGVIAIFCLGLQAHGATITWTDGLAGFVPNTSITYTITSNHDNLSSIVAGQTFDGEYDWASQGVGYRKTGGDIVTTITFSEPIPIKAFTTMAIDFESGKDTVSVSGGTADTADLMLDLGLKDPSISKDMNYNSATGELTLMSQGDRHDAQLVGNSNDTLVSFTHTASNVAPGDWTIVHFGIINNIVPEPAAGMMLVFGIGGVIGFHRRSRR